MPSQSAVVILAVLLSMCARDALAQTAAPSTSDQDSAVQDTSGFRYNFGVDYFVHASNRRHYPYNDDRFADDESFIWERLRPRFSATSKHVAIVLEGQDTHSIGGSFSVRKAWLDVLNAYVEGQHMRGWSFKVGRRQGDFDTIPRMVRTPDFAAVVRAFDVVEGGWENKHTEIRAFVFKPVENLPSRFNTWKRGEYLWTTYAKRTVGSHVLQSYVLARHNDEVTGESGVTGSGAVYAWEVQVTGTAPIPRVGWSVETVLQRGHYSTDTVRATGLFATATVAVSEQNELEVRYVRTSGDDVQGDGVRQTYDTFYGASGAYGTLGLSRGANLHAFSIVGTHRVSRPLTLYWRYTDNRLTNVHDAWYGGVTPALTREGADSSRVGAETNLMLTYRLSPRLNVRVGYHHFFPGAYLTNTGEHHPPSELRLQIFGGF